LLETLSAEGFTNQELLGAGLIKEAEGKPGTWYDRFRNRLMFPIRDAAGRVVAFTGRTLSVEEQAKYLELYHKSDILFGMDRAKDAIRTRGFTLLVEGQMDALLAHQAGFANTVALSGTALTEKHVQLMKRYSDNLMLVLDADSAGLTATAKSAYLPTRAGMSIKVATLPQGKDPADLLSADPKDFGERVKNAKPIIGFFLSRLFELEKDERRYLKEAARILLPLIKAIPGPIDRDRAKYEFCRATGIEIKEVNEKLQSMPLEADFDRPHEIKTLHKQMTYTVVSERETRELQLRAAHAAYPHTALAERIETEYSRITEVTLPAEAPESALFDAERAFGEHPEADAADELLHAFELAVIREAYQEELGKLRRAEAAGDSAAVARAEAACKALGGRLAAL
jgi:DNA primase